MNSLALRGLLILIGAFLMCFAVFVVQGVPMAEGGVRVDSTFFATVAAGTYALTSLAAIVFSRAVLGLFGGLVLRQAVLVCGALPTLNMAGFEFRRIARPKEPKPGIGLLPPS